MLEELDKRNAVYGTYQFRDAHNLCLALLWVRLSVSAPNRSDTSSRICRFSGCPHLSLGLRARPQALSRKSRFTPKLGFRVQGC